MYKKEDNQCSDEKYNVVRSKYTEKFVAVFCVILNFQSQFFVALFPSLMQRIFLHNFYMNASNLGPSLFGQPRAIVLRVSHGRNRAPVEACYTSRPQDAGTCPLSSTRGLAENRIRILHTHFIQ